jgi:endoglucanase
MPLKKHTYTKPITQTILFLSLSLVSFSQSQLAWQRAAVLGKGVNANQWLTSELIYFEPSAYQEQDFAQMKALGFEHVRLPVSFNNWFNVSTLQLNDSIFYFIDRSLIWSLKHKLKLVIDFHPSAAEDNLLLNPQNPDFDIHKRIIASIWKTVADRYKYVNSDSLYYDIYNEPTHVNEIEYSIFAKQVIDSIRSVEPNKTIILEGQLSNFTAIGEPNVMATFHFYNPSIFTHQGATWTPFPRNTTQIPFPYNYSTMPPQNPLDTPDAYTKYMYDNYDYFGTYQYLDNALNWLIAECQMFGNVPIYCGEFGVSNQAPLQSKLDWMKYIREELELRQIPWSVWSWKGFNTNASFQIFNCNNCINQDSVYENTDGYTVLCALGLSSDCSNQISTNHSSAYSDLNQIFIYPNPGSQKIMFSQDVTALEVYNQLGEKVLDLHTKPIQTLDCSVLMPGVYYFRLLSPVGWQTQKWVKQ